MDKQSLIEKYDRVMLVNQHGNNPHLISLVYEQGVVTKGLRNGVEYRILSDSGNLLYRVPSGSVVVEQVR